MLAPSFAAEFSYPSIIYRLKKLGFDKVVELTFGAKMINREYHRQLKKSKKLIISSVCPGITETIKNKFPKLKSHLIKVDSPMTATAKICRKTYPEHKIIFISPCHYKKIEAKFCPYIDATIDYLQLRQLFKKYKIKKYRFLLKKYNLYFDRFYNDYTKIYPLSGGLTKTAHINNIIKPKESKVINGIAKVQTFLKNPDPKIKFLDCTFCIGGCIGGPCTAKIPLKKKHKRILKYLKKSKKQDIPENRKGLIKKASGINFRENFLLK